MRKRLIVKCCIGVIAILVVILILNIWREYTEQFAYKPPFYNKINLKEIIGKETLTYADCEVISEQTGLHEEIIMDLVSANDIEKIYQIQEMFFGSPEIICKHNTPISWEERIADSEKEFYYGKFVGLETGDILITPNSHTYGFRNGHAAIVVDAEEGQTLEAVVLGEPVCIQSIRKWETVPTVIVLRLRNVSAEERKEIAEYAVQQMDEVCYGFTQDMFDYFWNDDIKNTHCSHMVWKCFKDFGYDLDSNGGIFVTPKDIAESDLLEVRQVYGIGEAY